MSDAELDRPLETILLEREFVQQAARPINEETGEIGVFAPDHHSLRGPAFLTPSGHYFFVEAEYEQKSFERDIMRQERRITFGDQNDPFRFSRIEKRDEQVGLVYTTPSGVDQFLTPTEYQAIVDEVEPERYAPEPYKRFFRGEDFKGTFQSGNIVIQQETQGTQYFGDHYFYIGSDFNPTVYIDYREGCDAVRFRKINLNGVPVDHDLEILPQSKRAKMEDMERYQQEEYGRSQDKVVYHYIPDDQWNEVEQRVCDWIEGVIKGNIVDEPFPITIAASVDVQLNNPQGSK